MNQLTASENQWLRVGVPARIATSPAQAGLVHHPEPCRFQEAHNGSTEHARPK
jgi:hypothetical protein